VRGQHADEPDEQVRGVVTRALAVVAVVAATAGPARADPPSNKVAVATAKAWVRGLASDSDGADALAITAEPFLFDHDATPCKSARLKTKAILACLIQDTQNEVGDWTPTRVRIEDDATFTTWQSNPRRDVIDQHRKQLARLTDHAFVHFDSAAPGGTFEIVIAVKVDDGGHGVVDGFLANFLPSLPLPDEAAARTAASKWTEEVAGDADTRLAAVARTGLPFWSYGLPHGEGKSCKDEVHATDTRQLAAAFACIATGDTVEALAKLPRGKWEIVTDPGAIATSRDADDDHFAAQRGMLDRLSFDHVLLYDRWHEDDNHLEIVVAARIDKANRDHVVIDAVVANFY
jgi:hypothetical protein